jgi:hypothetical protein
VQDLTPSTTAWPAGTIRPEHAVELFRLGGGGAPDDFVPILPAQLATLPGTSHTMLVARPEWLGSMILALLDGLAQVPDSA